LYAENVWFFPPSTYYQWPEDYLQPFSFDGEGMWDIMGGLTGSEVKVPNIVCSDKYIYTGTGGNGCARLARKDISIDGNLYQKAVVRESSCAIIEGGGYCTVVADFNKEICRKAILLRRDMLKGVFPVYSNGYSDLFDVTWIMPNIVKSVKMSAPFLKETVKGQRVVYDDDILRFRWFSNGLHWLEGIFVNDSTPMVEGAEGNGKGVTLDIDFHVPSDNLVVLNGFVDTDRPHLYKMNARMKTVRVQGDGFDFEYTFKDYVHFAQIDFPKQVTKVKLTVADVYDGEKWEDMAISGLWVNPDILKQSRNTEKAYKFLEYAKQYK